MIRESDICVQSSFGHTIKNGLLTQQPQSDALVVLFPGGNGTCDIPLLHYARKVALQAACDVLSIEYGYVRTAQSLSRELYDSILKETRQAVESCDLLQYRRVYFISKSFGTLIAGELRDQLSPLPIRSLYLTPLEDTAVYLDKPNCTVVAGDQDKLFPDVSVLRNMSGIDLHVFSGANHSLEVPDDYQKSLDMLARVADICNAFCSQIGELQEQLNHRVDYRPKSCRLMERGPRVFPLRRTSLRNKGRCESIKRPHQPRRCDL